MRRVFRDIQEGELEQQDHSIYLEYFGLERGDDWSELLKSDRILIISEAGAGKTHECKSQRDALWEAGEPAFMLELASLATSSPLGLFKPRERQRFEAWCNSGSDIATFFLDSVDELKLTQGSFATALGNFSSLIEGNLGRSKIVITSRPTPVDQQLFKEYLPVPEPTEDLATDEDFARVVMKERTHESDTEAPPAFRAVRMLPLSDKQIRQMAEIQGVTNPDEMIEDIERRNAEEFARRPQDLIELCADWREHRRIRTHYEQVENNVATKLRANTERRERAPLSADQARNGAEQLALAALLTRKLTLRHSTKADQVVGLEAALDPVRVLTSWNDEERQTLLERSLFGFSSYGRVRFHHRSVIEFLAAERISALLDRGLPIKSAKRLLFATTAQGDDIVKPSLREVTAWLALKNDIFFNELIRRQPSVLLEYGDPESLSPKKRAAVLTAYVQRYGVGGWRGLQIPSIQVHRFALSDATDLPETINSLWDQGIENPEVRELLLQLIGVGKLTACADIAYNAVNDGNALMKERIIALRALVEIDDPRLPSIVVDLLQNSNPWPNQLASWAIILLFPKYLGAKALCQILDRINQKKNAIGGLRWELPKLINSPLLTISDLDELRLRFTTLICAGLCSKHDGTNITTKREFLVPALSATCLRLISEGISNSAVIKSAVISSRLLCTAYSDDELPTNLKQALCSLNSAGRRSVFDEHLSFIQQLHELEDPIRRFRTASFYGPLELSPEEDTEWVFKALADKQGLSDYREVMLEAALYLWDCSEEQKDQIRGLVSDNPVLADTLERRTKPAHRDPRIVKYEKQAEKAAEQRQKKKAKTKGSWMLFWRELVNNPEAAFSDSRMESTIWSLWKAMARSGEESRASGWNRSFIESNFGRDTADLLRTALMRVWRGDLPSIRSEREESEKETTLVSWELGVAAIAAEAEDPQWAKNLSHGEACLAARYAPIAQNGLPAWLGALAEHHPKAIDQILGNGLSCELSEDINANAHPMTLQNISYYPPSLAKLFVPRIEAWLNGPLEVIRKFKDQPPAAYRLSKAVNIVLRHGSKSSLKNLRDIALRELKSAEEDSIRAIFLSTLFTLDPKAGVDELENTLSRLPIEKCGKAVFLFATLFGDRHDNLEVRLTDLDIDPEQLLRLLRLGYTHVRRSDDEVHESSYTPGTRDYAERGRDLILKALFDSGSNAGWKAKQAMIEDPLFEHFKDRVAAIAIERSAHDCDARIFIEEEVLKLERNGDIPPATSADMYALMIDRLSDLDDILLEDSSPRAGWACVDDENTMRQLIAHQLISSSRAAYTVDQEGVTADSKETDIRLRSTSGPQAVIELKIGEKKRSITDLKLAIKDQLVTKYMAPRQARAGCLMITLANDKVWRHPETNKLIDFPAVIELLNNEAELIEEQWGGEIRLTVKGLDLRPRLPPERSTPTL
ncbi:hypothetical protein [Microbulbifer mangrovi]|uniref:hypothetical protein n=1 Tax=Microbulbifer mangrovi TaxID=927787 RepID=UPI000990999C|nr:hypothetical protein [Microbulbifer mangrovi]